MKSLPYMFVATSERCAREAIAFIRTGMGRGRVRRVCGKDIHESWRRVLVTVVIAKEGYATMCRNARTKIMNRDNPNRAVPKCFKIPRYLAKQLDEFALRKGVSVSDIIREALAEYLSKHNDT